MRALQRKPGFAQVVESLPLDRLEVGVCAAMLRVAGLAPARDLAVHALFCRHPLGDRTMAREAARGFDRPGGGRVALRALAGRAERLVRTGERPGHRFLLGERGTRQDDRQKDGQNPDRSTAHEVHLCWEVERKSRQ